MHSNLKFEVCFKSGLIICLLGLSIVEAWIVDPEVDADTDFEVEVLRRDVRAAKSRKIVTQEYTSGVILPGSDESSSSSSEESTKQNAKTGGGLKKLQKAALDATNFYRQNHGVPDLKLDAGLQKSAQAYADKLAKTDVWAHSCGKGKPPCTYGENLAYAVNQPDWSIAVRAAVNHWYDEIKKYKYSNPVFTPAAGHFTQLIWKGSKLVGFGVAQSKKSGKIYTVAHFSPPGNNKKKFKENVLPLVKKG